jgi:hypothetical protein
MANREVPRISIQKMDYCFQYNIGLAQSCCKALAVSIRALFRIRDRLEYLVQKKHAILDQKLPERRKMSLMKDLNGVPMRIEPKDQASINETKWMWANGTRH